MSMRQTDMHIEELYQTFENDEYFQVQDVMSLYKKYNPEITKTTINWRINTLIKSGQIHRIGRAKYKLGTEKVFTPTITTKILKLSQLIKSNFPYINYAIWHISEINTLSQHLLNKDTFYVEVERIAVDSVFEHLKGKNKFVLKGNSNDDIFFGESIVVVRPLVTGSPTQLVDNVSTITIEKLLVDLFVDKEFLFLQGLEITHIYSNAFSKYSINIDRLLRYASRKEKRTVIDGFIKTII